MAKISSEVASAAMIHAMLNGESISNAANVQVDIDVDSLVETDDNDNDTSEDYGGKEVINGIEIDIDDEGKSKSKKKTPRKTAKKVSKTDEELKAERALEDRLPEYKYAELKKSEKFVVVLNQHDIPYKEQLWNIDRRQVVYEVSRIDSKTAASRAVKAMYNDDNIRERLDMAYAGENRYYEIRVLEEIVPTKVTVIGYIEITPNKKDNKIKLRKSDMESCHISYSDVISDVRKVVKALVRYK